MQNEVISLAHSVGTLFERLLYFQKYFRFMDAQPDVRNPPQPRQVPDGPLTVRFEHVSFAYPDGRQALNDVNLEMAPARRSPSWARTAPERARS